MTDVATDPNAAPAQDTPPADNGGGGESWLESVPEAYRDSGFVTKYDSPEEFFKGMDNLSKLAGQKAQGLVAPGEEASDEERAAFQAGLRELSGVPETLDEYTQGLSLPELGEGAMMPKFIEMGFNHGVAPSALQGMIGDLSKALETEEAAAMEAYDKHVKESMDTLKNEWDQDYDYNMNVAERFTSEFSDEVRQMLADANWKNNAAMVRDLHALGSKFLAEGDLAQVSRASGGDTPNMNTLVGMKGDPRYADPDSRDENYVKEVHEYAKRLTEYEEERKKQQ